MASAHYQISIPTQDELGNHLSEKLPSAVHHWLHKSQPRLFQTGQIKGPHKQAPGHNAEQWVHHYETVSPDTPETDSYIKQASAHIGNLVNHPVIHSQKTGKNGPEPWIVTNKTYVPGQSAHPAVLKAPVSPSPVVPSLGSRVL